MNTADNDGEKINPNARIIYVISCYLKLFDRISRNLARHEFVHIQIHRHTYIYNCIYTQYACADLDVYIHVGTII